MWGRGGGGRGRERAGYVSLQKGNVPPTQTFQSKHILIIKKVAKFCFNMVRNSSDNNLIKQVRLV